MIVHLSEIIGKANSHEILASCQQRVKEGTAIYHKKGSYYELLPLR